MNINKLNRVLILVIYTTVLLCNTNSKASPPVYHYDFAVVNKSFLRDLKRSLNLYQSFEKYFVGASDVPFYIILPKKDLKYFEDKFAELKNQGHISNLPKFLTELEVLERCAEPDITREGYWTQQVCKLCFGLLGIAKNYLVLDSDCYFTKRFDKKILFIGDKIKTYAGKLTDDDIKENKEERSFFLRKPPIFNNINIYDSRMLPKKFFGNRNPIFYDFVIAGPIPFSSDAVFRMRNFIKDKELNFSMLINLYPWEFQWYGEYMLQHENFFLMPRLFTYINSNKICVPEVGLPGHYGIAYQSILYSPASGESEQRDDDDIVYLRSSHCK